MALQRIGFIGLGSQGGPMAERIVAAGHSLTVWARRAEALEPFLATGASAAASVAATRRAVRPGRHLRRR
jgi:3-hydroxyisobutyrate dehydrogenase